MKKTIFAIAAVVLLASVVVSMPSADAESIDYGTHYCYGDNPILMPLRDGGQSVWTVTDEDGASIEAVPMGDGNVTIDISGSDRVTVVQTVGDESASMVLVALHLPQSGDEDGIYTVTFHSNGDVVGIAQVTKATVVQMGSNHVVMPADPQRSGYVFGGWYTDDRFIPGTEFDPAVPVEGDTDVYARWTPVGGTGGGSGSGGTGGGTVVVGEQHTVTFDCVVGLGYNVVSTGMDHVSFTVGAMDGFTFASGSISVQANGVAVQAVDGVYTVDVHSDVLVTITGTPVYSGGESTVEDSGIGMLTWIILLIAVILLIVAAYLWYRSRQQQQEMS